MRSLLQLGRHKGTPFGVKTLALAGMALLSGLATAQAAQISLPRPSVPTGASVVLPLNWASQSTSVSGIQFDLQYDNSALSVTAVMGGAAAASGKTLYHVTLAPGRERYLIVGLNQNSVADGTLINLLVGVASTALGGTYPLKLLNVLGTDAFAQAVTVAAVDGSITTLAAVISGSPLEPTGVLNGASLLPGPLAPGEIVSLFGAGIGPASPQSPIGAPTNASLGGTSVLFGGSPAPLLYASPNQVNVIVPYGIQGRVSTQLQVTRWGQSVSSLQLAVADAAPAVFTMDGSGVGPGAILDQNYALNSRSTPAAKGSAIMIFATGAGQTDPPGVDGQIVGAALPKPRLPVTVQIGGLDAKVLYAGAAPGLVAGVLQVNCIVPLNSPSGYAVPIMLSVGKIGSRAGVTVAIQ